MKRINNATRRVHEEETVDNVSQTDITRTSTTQKDIGKYYVSEKVRWSVSSNLIVHIYHWIDTK